MSDTEKELVIRVGGNEKLDSVEDDRITYVRKIQQSPEYELDLQVYQCILNLFESINRTEAIQSLILYYLSNSTIDSLSSSKLKEILGPKASSTYSYHRTKLVDSNLFYSDKKKDSFKPKRVITLLKKNFDYLREVDKKILNLKKTELKRLIQVYISTLAVPIKTHIIFTLDGVPEGTSFNFSQLKTSISFLSHVLLLKSPDSSLISKHLRSLEKEKFITINHSRYHLTVDGKRLADFFFNIFYKMKSNPLIEKPSLFPIEARISDIKNIVEKFVPKKLQFVASYLDFKIMMYDDLYLVLKQNFYEGILPSHCIPDALSQEWTELTFEENVMKKLIRISPMLMEQSLCSAIRVMKLFHNDRIPICEQESVIGFLRLKNFLAKALQHKNIYESLKNNLNGIEGWALSGRSALAYYAPFLNIRDENYTICVKNDTIKHTIKQFLPHSFVKIEVNSAFFDNVSQPTLKPDYPILAPEVLILQLLESDDDNIRKASIFVLPFIKPAWIKSLLDPSKSSFTRKSFTHLRTLVYFIKALWVYYDNLPSDSPLKTWFSIINQFDPDKLFESYGFLLAKTNFNFKLDSKKKKVTEIIKYSSNWDILQDLFAGVQPKFEPQMIDSLYSRNRFYHPLFKNQIFVNYIRD